MTQPRLGDWLIKRGLLNEADLKRALDEARKHGDRLASQLVKLRLLTEGTAVEALAGQLGVPGIDLTLSAIKLTHLSLIPGEVAKLEHILPLSVANGRLLLAMADTANRQVIEEIQLVSGLSVLPHVALSSHLRQVIDEAYDARGKGRQLWIGEGLPKSAAGEILGLLVPSSPPPSSQEIVIELEDDGEPEIVLESEEEEALIIEDDDVAGIEGEIAAAKPAARFILVVDDDPEILTLVSRMLEKKGYRVEKARNGTEALEKITLTPPELILLDANLPDIHGFDICKRLKSNPRFERIPVLIMTAVFRGWRFAQDSRESFGANDYIEKPFHIEDLLRRVEHHLSQSGSPPAREKEKAEKLYQEGVKLLEGKLYAKAVEVLKKSIEADAFNARAHHQLGRALQANGDGYGAIGAYERSVDLRPEHFQTLRALAALYQQTGFRRKAIETWERSISAAPDDATRQKIKASLMEIL